MITNLIKKNINILNQFEIDVKKIEKFFPLYRHFDINTTGLERIGKNIFLVTSKNNGFLSYTKTLPNLVINKLIHNQLTYELKRSPAYCRYDYSSGACSKSKNIYYRVIPIGEFNLYQSSIVKDLGKDLIMDLKEEFKNQLLNSKSLNDLNNDFLKYIENIVNSYSKEKHSYNTNEILLDCEKYLLVEL
ncbi:hypothetical protein N5U14_07110 [Aliarcobacter butzleri]|uniref:hypothetical protein n=1 Tax=Aliarcobacter butzleri TaxID=28197 RepID=UPI0021B1F3CF|nr:hypothetical protein [Aliarcobacter butzleri]MCT7610612.1 hypothetical protein [Aliarcobacter butzleri]